MGLYETRLPTLQRSGRVSPTYYMSLGRIDSIAIIRVHVLINYDYDKPVPLEPHSLAWMGPLSQDGAPEP